jgi:hypothetical protein
MLLRPARVQRSFQLAGVLSAGLPGPALQRAKDGRKAKGVTVAEFKDTMKGIMSTVNSRLQNPAARAAWEAVTGGTPEERPPIYSFDNPSVHTDLAALQELGLADDEGKPTSLWLPLPTYSGDLHRTIERVHARVCGDFEAWLLQDCKEYDMQQYVAKLSEIFMKTQTPATIFGCMWGKPSESLDALYRSVVERNGGRPPHHLR